MKNLIVLISVALAIAGCKSNPGSQSTAVQSASAASLSGQWFQKGKPTSLIVAPDSRHVTITNPDGTQLSGSMKDHDIVISSLGKRGMIRGKVSDGGRRISWSNGVEWTR